MEEDGSVNSAMLLQMIPLSNLEASCRSIGGTIRRSDDPIRDERPLLQLRSVDKEARQLRLALADVGSSSSGDALVELSYLSDCLEHLHSSAV